MSHALLTVDRGDRMPMYNHCLAQVSRFVNTFDEHIQIIRAPKNGQPDLTERIKEGYDIAVEKGYSWVVIIESDDYYSDEYVHAVMMHADNADFIGSEFTFYFNLKNRTWQRLYHPNHSSLFQTAFRVKAMEKFNWKLAHKVFLDLDIWKFARKNNFRRKFIDPHAIGIKTGMGLVGGKAHKMVFANKDPDLTWLASKVDKESLEFYKSLSL